MSSSPDWVWSRPWAWGRARLGGFARRQERRRGSPNSRSPTLPARSPASFRAAQRRGSSIPTTGWSPRSSARSTTSSSTRSSAADQAIADSGWSASTEEEQVRAGVLIGSGIGGLQGIDETSLLLQEKGPRRVSPFFIPGRLINLAAGYVSIKHGLKGPNHAVVTACSTGAHAIGDAARLIALGDADVMVAGGAEELDLPLRHRRVCRLPRAFHRLQRPARARRRGPTTATATASSWAKGPASSCLRATSTPRRAARRSTPRSSATACRATPITSRPRPRTATAPSAA